MIYDSLSNLHTYISVHPLFHIVLEYIDSRNLSALDNGKISLSEGIYAVVDNYETKAIRDKFIECHRKYIDIQIVIEGVEQIGICNKNECITLEEYNKETDLEKLEGQIDLVTLRKGYFAIFFPEDAHVPGLIHEDNIKDKIKKIVFKVPVIQTTNKRV